PRGRPAEHGAPHADRNPPRPPPLHRCHSEGAGAPADLDPPLAARRPPDDRAIPSPLDRPGRLEAPRDDALSLRDVLYGEGVAAVEWFDRLLPAAGDEVLPITLRVRPGGGRTIRRVLARFA